MTTAMPIPYRWSGSSFEPLPRFVKECDATYVIGEVYRLAPVNERSIATHAHEFAWLDEAWQNLPEAIADQYPSVEHLRKRGLIAAGYYDETIVDAGSNAAAIRVAAAFRSREEFALVIVRGHFVIIRTAKSQSRRAMNAKEFQTSKTALMEVVANLIGVSPDQLGREAGRAA